jgi:hypothetical protein
MADILPLSVGDHALHVTFLGGIAGILAGSCDKLGDMALGETLYRVQRTLNLNQKELARLMGCSSRTIIRYYKRGGVLAPNTYAELAAACHPHDVALAAHLAQEAGKTLVSMGLQSSPAGHGDSPAVAPRGPSPSGKHLVDSIVCAAAEAMQTPPHAMRPALMAAFERAFALGMTAEEVLKGMAVEPAAKGTKGKAGTA